MAGRIYVNIQAKIKGSRQLPRTNSAVKEGRPALRESSSEDALSDDLVIVIFFRPLNYI